jgi:hypothetical protein
MSGRTTTGEGSSRLVGRRRRSAIVALLALLVFLLWGGQAPTAAASGGRHGGGAVLPPSAEPLGYSRADMTRLLAQFTSFGNDPQYYPDTPFQVLYVDPSRFEPPLVVTRSFQPCPRPDSPACGLLFTQSEPPSNTFVVAPGTLFFVPVDNANDSLPIAGTFPTTERGAKRYVFEPRQLGGKDFSISVDGDRVRLGPAYVAGPVETPPLPDDGSHMITIGAFLGPLPPGVHTVRITGGYYGRAIRETYDVAFIALDFTYQVTVAAP